MMPPPLQNSFIESCGGKYAHDVTVEMGNASCKRDIVPGRLRQPRDRFLHEAGRAEPRHLYGLGKPSVRMDESLS
jgi:hypothetical protein